MKDRILEILKEESLSSAKFADEIGVQRSSVYHVLSGRNKPSLDFLQKIISRYRAINTEWLLTGRGSMYKDQGTPKNLFSSQQVGKEEDQPQLDPKSVQLEENRLSEDESEHVIQVQDDQESVKNAGSKTLKRVLLLYSDGSLESFIP
ncbi:MAG: transcriptional regulator [Marinilabiliales bacterium]|nr:MAG: transcriptional regulator [Marinilabiliales bacterium]